MKWPWPKYSTVKTWVTVHYLASHFMLHKETLSYGDYCYKETLSCTVIRNFFMPDLTINPNLLCSTLRCSWKLITTAIR